MPGVVFLKREYGKDMIDPNEKLKYVELKPHDPAWSSLFIEAEAEIQSILQDNCIEIHHIGSTAIPDIHAKPIIDVLPVVKDISLVDSFNAKFEAQGYVCMGEYGIPGRRFYWKSKSKRTHNIHLFEQGSPEISKYLRFKEFMLSHEDYAKAYSLIKCSLAEVFSQDIESYVNGKASFVQLIDYKAGVARAAQLSAQDNIIIEKYNPAWPKLAAAEINAIKGMTGQLSYVSIEHLGSTAVPELASKPIIDIFITLDSFQFANEWIKALEALGYIYWDENPDKSHLRFFKGMPPFGEKRTHHVHILEIGNPSIEHRILFRDILRRNEKTRRDYEALKIELSQSHESDREVYTDNKAAFIEKVLRENGYLKPITR